MTSGFTPAQPGVSVNPSFDPFEKHLNKQPEIPLNRPFERGEWQRLFDPLKGMHPGREEKEPESETTDLLGIFEREPDVQATLQLFNRYIVSSTGKGILIIDQQNAHERILYERFLKTLRQGAPSQKILIPEKVNVSTDDAMLLRELVGPLADSGLEITEFGNDTFLVHSLPVTMDITDIQGLVELILEDFKEDTDHFLASIQIRLARTFAKKASVKSGKKLQNEEMRTIMENLLACNVPETTPDGRQTMLILLHDDLQKKFKS
jgi:DNA mismatch repair protein MutL